MSRTVHCFLALLRDDEPNDIIDDMWEKMNANERLEAIEIADEDELTLMEGPSNDLESVAEFLFLSKQDT